MGSKISFKREVGMRCFLRSCTATEPLVFGTNESHADDVGVSTSNLVAPASDDDTVPHATELHDGTNSFFKKRP